MDSSRNECLQNRSSTSDLIRILDEKLLSCGRQKHQRDLHADVATLRVSMTRNGGVRDSHRRAGGWSMNSTVPRATTRAARLAGTMADTHAERTLHQPRSRGSNSDFRDGALPARPPPNSVALSGEHPNQQGPAAREAANTMLSLRMGSSASTDGQAADSAKLPAFLCALVNCARFYGAPVANSTYSGNGSSRIASSRSANSQVPVVEGLSATVTTPNLPVSRPAVQHFCRAAEWSLRGPAEDPSLRHAKYRINIDDAWAFTIVSGLG